MDQDIQAGRRIISEQAGAAEPRNHVTWITGASSGIGEALAVACANRGHDLVLSARRQAELERVAERCRAVSGGESTSLVLPLDVTHEPAMPVAVEHVIGNLGRIDWLINNAGVTQRSLAVDTDMAVYRRIFEVDVLGQIALTKAVLPVMLNQGGGLIAVTSSIAGKMGVPYRTGYCAAKHAVMGYFDALRAELANSGIQVSTILPGFVRTNIATHALTGDGGEFGRTDKNIANGMDPDDCAEVVVRALLRGKPEIPVVRGLERHSLWLKRLAPGLVMRMASKVGKPE